jgi:hypothetical protein
MCTKSNTDTELPKRQKLRTERLDPNSICCTTESLSKLPTATAPAQLRLDPNRTKARVESELPMSTKFRTLAFEPKRRNERTDIELPNSTAARIDVFMPICAMPVTERAEPNRTYARTEKEEPKLVASRTLRFELNRPVPRNDRLEPNIKESNVETRPARREKSPTVKFCVTRPSKHTPNPAAETELPTRANARIEIDDPRWRLSRADVRLPNLVLPRTDKEEAICVKPTTLMR